MNILPDSVNKMLLHDGFSKWLGIEVLETSKNKSVVRMKVRQEMLNGFSVCHGGITFSLADSAMAFASNAEGKISMSIDNSITYHEKVFEGDVLTATAEELSSNYKISVYNVVVMKDDNRIVAHFKGIVYKTNKELLTNET